MKYGQQVMIARAMVDDHAIDHIAYLKASVRHRAEDDGLIPIQGTEVIDIKDPHGPDAIIPGLDDLPPDVLIAFCSVQCADADMRTSGISAGQRQRNA